MRQKKKVGLWGRTTIILNKGEIEEAWLDNEERILVKGTKVTHYAGSEYTILTIREDDDCHIGIELELLSDDGKKSLESTHWMIPILKQKEVSTIGHGKIQKKVDKMEEYRDKASDYTIICKEEGEDTISIRFSGLIDIHRHGHRHQTNSTKEALRFWNEEHFEEIID